MFQRTWETQRRMWGEDVMVKPPGNIHNDRTSEATPGA